MDLSSRTSMLTLAGPTAAEVLRCPRNELLVQITCVLTCLAFNFSLS